MNATPGRPEPGICPECGRVITDPLRDHKMDCGQPREIALTASAPQSDPAAHTAWISRIRELRLAGHTLGEARDLAGPMPGQGAGRQARRAEDNRASVRELLGTLQPRFAAILAAAEADPHLCPGCTVTAPALAAPAITEQET